MPHKLVGSLVTYTRPVIIKPGFRRMNEKEEPEEVAAVVEMQQTEATVVGVEPRFDKDGASLCPGLHLAFLHPDRLHHLSGSGWRDAFDRALSVRARSHPDVAEHVAYYENQAVGDEMYWLRMARERKLAVAKAAEERAAAEKQAADDKAAAEKKAQAEKAAADKKAADEKAKAEKKAAANEKTLATPMAEPGSGEPSGQGTSTSK